MSYYRDISWLEIAEKDQRTNRGTLLPFPPPLQRLLLRRLLPTRPRPKTNMGKAVMTRWRLRMRVVVA